MIFLYLTFSLLLAQAEMTGAMDGTGHGGYSGDRLVQVFYVPFNTQYWREITAGSIESRGDCLVASSKSYFGVKLGGLLEQAKREGFAGATQYFLDFDDGKIRAKIVYGDDVYLVDYFGKLRKENGNRFAMSKETFLEMSHLFFRFSGVSHLDALKRQGYKVKAPKHAKKTERKPRQKKLKGRHLHRRPSAQSHK